MNLQVKLGLMFGTLTFLLIVSSVLSFVLVKRIDSDVQNLGRVVAPLNEAVLEMQISISEGNKSIIQYANDRDDDHIRRFLETKIDFDQALGVFTTLAKSDAEKEAGLRVGQIHGGFGEISNDIIGVTNSLQASLTRLSQGVANIDQILNDQLEASIDREAPDGLAKFEAVANMGIRVDKGFLALQSYMASPDPAFRQTVIEEQEGFREFEALFRSTSLSISEELVLGTVHDVFTDTVSLSRRILDQVDEQRILLVSLADGLDEIDRIVNEDVQPLIAAGTAEALDGADSSLDGATLAVFILIALGVVVGLGTAMIVGRQIVNPIVRLTNVAGELGRGNLAVRASAETGDEIGSLANSFNQMAAARQQAEAQRGALIGELAEQNAELAELDEMKDSFLSSVSHELRTPLTAIKGSAELLLDDEDMPEEVQKEFLAIINVESDRLTRLINDVLDLSRYEAGQEIWNDALHPIGDIVDSAVSGIHSLAIQKSLAIDVSLETDLPEVWCDSDKINQVLTNLLSNAIKFTPDGGKIGISVKELAADGESAVGDQARFHARIMEVRVSDNGIGIPKGELTEIFEKFKQVGAAPTDVQKGTGLGLPICKEIVGHYGGNIWAESDLGQGTVFVFNLPVENGIELDETISAHDPDSSLTATG